MMRHLSLRLIAIAALLAPLFVVGAEAAPVSPGTVVKAPDWSVGSEWHYSDGYAMKVASVSPKGTVFDRLDAPGQQFTRQGFVRTDSVSGTGTRNAIYRTIPDAAGYSLSAAKPLTFQREYLNDGKLLVHASSWTVEGRETITVPAGTFDCWVIVWRTRSLRSDWTGFERWWYSPEAQNYVRMEFKYGPEPEGSRVLMNYRLAGSQPGAVAANPVAAPVTADPVTPAQVVAASAPAREIAAPVPVKDEPKASAKPAEIKIAAAPVKKADDVPLPLPAPVFVKARKMAALPARHAVEIALPELPAEEAPLPLPARASVKARNMAALPAGLGVETALPELPAEEVSLPLPAPASVQARAMAALPAGFAVETALPELPAEEAPLPLPVPYSIRAPQLAALTLPADFAKAVQVVLPESAAEISPPPAQDVAANDIAVAASAQDEPQAPSEEVDNSSSVPQPPEISETPAHPEPVKTASAKRPTLPQGDKSGPWHAQLGASLDAANVRTSLKKILARNPGAHELPGGITVRNVEGQTFYRAWLGSYASAPQARSLCDALDLKKVRISGCTIFKGPTTMEARAN